MSYEKYPAEVLRSMDAHLRMTKLYMDNWTLEELIRIEAEWKRQSTPKEYLDAITDQIKKRDIRNGGRTSKNM